MLKQLLDKAAAATSYGEEQKAKELISQVARSSDPEVMDVVMKALRGEGTKLQQYITIQVIQLLGYPKNEPAIPDLIYHLGDPNLPGWYEAAQTLKAIGIDVLMPYLIRSLLDQDAAIQFDKHTSPTWQSNVEGVCYWLTYTHEVEKEYARRCCPAITYLLSRADFSERPGAYDIDALLDVIEKAEIQDEYIIPALITVAQKYYHSEVRKHARMLLATFKQEALAPYKLWDIPLQNEG